MDDNLNTRQTLLKKIKDRHDDASWEDFVYYYRNYIYMVIRGMNINHHDAEEIVQMVLLKVWEKLPEFDYDSQKGKFRNWLCTVTVNTVKNFLRKRKSSLERIEKIKRKEVENYLNRVTVPDVEALARKEWETFIANMAWKNISEKMADNQKQAFLMMADGKPVSEIAEKLGITESSVYVYKKRVQDKLCREINHLEDELS